MKDDDRRRGTGALTPPELRWTKGLTAASIAFVQEAELHAAKHSTSADAKRRLAEAVEEVKGGRMVLTDWLPIKNFLRNGFRTR